MNQRQKAERACDDALRDYVRWRDAPGYVFQCFACRRHLPKMLASVGHFRKRRHLATRWYNKNCHLICGVCQDEGKKKNDLNYAYWLDEIYGKGTAEQITILSNRDIKYTIPELLDIADALRKRIK